MLAAGAHVVIVLKQEARALYEAADELRAVLAPGLVAEGARTTRLWDLPELDAFPTLGRPVRVVWAEEATVRRRRVGGQLQEGIELASLWHMDHCFVHHVVAVDALLLTLALAFVLTYLFYARNLKPTARRPLTRLALADRLREDFAQPGGRVWPEGAGPG